MSATLSMIADVENASLFERTKSNLSKVEHLEDRARDASVTASIADYLPDGVLRIDRHGRVLESNQTVYHLFQPRNTPLAHIADLLPVEIQQPFLLTVQEALQSRLLQQIDFELHGEHFLRQFEARLQPVTETEVVVIFRDITEQRWLQQARAFSGSYFQSLLQHLNTGVLICTSAGEIVLANHALLRLLYQRDEDLVGEDYAALARRIAHDEETLTALLKQYQCVTSNTPIVPQVTVEIISPNGASHSWLLVNAELEHNQETQTRQLKFTFTDVTDFRNAEIALRESEEQYAALLDRVTDVIYHLDQQQEILFLNAAWPRLTNYTVEDSLGRRIMDFIHPEDRAICAAAFQSPTPSESSTDIEVRLLRPTGGECWVVLRNQQNINTEGSIIGNYGMMINITDRKRSESARAALAAKARTIELLTQLLTNLSHDLRTPLSIIGVTNFKVNRYWDQLEVGQRTEALARVDDQVSRISAFLEEYSDLARLDIDLTDFKTSPVALHPLIESLVHTMQNGQPHFDWVYQCDHKISFIQGHHHWLSKMVRHVLDNAAQFSPETGRIEVRLFQQDQQVILEVIDAGIGIAEADMEHIFEPFYRADKARAVETGLAGLGLTFVKRIMEAHRGTVQITSALGIGTTVRLTFPHYPTD